MPDFYIARHLVTVAQFKMFVEASGVRPRGSRLLSGRSEYPAVYVSWNEAIDYCRWLEGTLRASDTVVSRSCS